MSSPLTAFAPSQEEHKGSRESRAEGSVCFLKRWLLTSSATISWHRAQSSQETREGHFWGAQAGPLSAASARRGKQDAEVLCDSSCASQPLPDLCIQPHPVLTQHSGQSRAAIFRRPPLSQTLSLPLQGQAVSMGKTWLVFLAPQMT